MEIQWFSSSTCLVPWPWLRSHPGERGQSVGFKKGPAGSEHRVLVMAMDLLGGRNGGGGCSFPPCLLPPSSLAFLPSFHFASTDTGNKLTVLLCWCPRKGTSHRMSKSPHRTQPLGPELSVTGLGGLGATEWDPAWPLCDLQGNWRDSIRWRWTGSLEWSQNASLLGWPSDRGREPGLEKALDFSMLCWPAPGVGGQSCCWDQLRCMLSFQNSGKGCLIW